MPAEPMTETPPIPPAVAGQMGGGPDKPAFSGVGAMMAKRPAPASPGGADPHGALKSAADAVTKVIDNMASMDKEGAAFAARIKQMLESWVAEAAKRGPGGGAGTPPPGAMTKPPEPPSTGAGFTG